MAIRPVDLEGLSRPDLPEADFVLGILYSEGLGVTKDFRKAFSHFQSAARGGLAWAQYALAGLYEAGTGVEKDLSMAAKWYREAANKNHPGAVYALGLMYQRGLGVPMNVAEAVSLFRLGMELDHPLATLELAKCYEEGIGVPPDHDRARELYFAAAKSTRPGAASAHGAIALLYKEGRVGLPFSESEAKRWYASFSERMREETKLRYGDEGS